jgi:N-acetylglucosamine-6-phosphate deacetylase
MRFALTGSRVFDGDTIRTGVAVLVEDTRIAAIVEESQLDGDVPRRRLDGGLLAPGFIDVQVNGGGGTLFNADPSPQGIARLAQAHRRFGTTGLLPTVITDRPQVLERAIAAVRAARAADVPGVLGIHAEGPFLDPPRRGAHDAHHIRQIADADVAALESADCGALMLTLAPNRVAPALIARLARAGILVSLGHSAAAGDEAQAALAAGARAFTHLFNAMSQMENRKPGMVGVALADRESYCSIIADGHHVDDITLKVALAAKPRDRIMLITDAMSTAAGGPDSFDLQGRLVTRVDGRLELDDGTLAGSDLTMDAAVRHCVAKLGLPLEDALRSASLNPATFLGRDHDLGRIAPGHLASLVHLNDALQVCNTWINGA